MFMLRTATDYRSADICSALEKKAQMKILSGQLKHCSTKVYLLRMLQKALACETNIRLLLVDLYFA